MRDVDDDHLERGRAAYTARAWAAASDSLARAAPEWERWHRDVLVFAPLEASTLRWNPLDACRTIGDAQQLTAQQGMYQQMLGGKTAQMLRLRLDPALACVPEISANKYVLNIRFLSQNGEEPRSQRTAESDVPFELTFCNL